MRLFSWQGRNVTRMENCQWLRLLSSFKLNAYEKPLKIGPHSVSLLFGPPAILPVCQMTIMIFSTATKTMKLSTVSSAMMVPTQTRRGPAQWNLASISGKIKLMNFLLTYIESYFLMS